MIGQFLLLAAAQVVNPPPPITTMPAEQGRTLGGHIQLQAGHEVVGAHVFSLWAGNLDRAMALVADDVQTEVTNGKMHFDFPKGKQSALASYIAMMGRGKSNLLSADCAPATFDNQSVTQCEFFLSSSELSSHFTMRYVVSGGKITKIYSWANHDEHGKPN